jgi:hypothetical protein
VVLLRLRVGARWAHCGPPWSHDWDHECALRGPLTGHSGPYLARGGSRVVMGGPWAHGTEGHWGRLRCALDRGEMAYSTMGDAPHLPIPCAWGPLVVRMGWSRGRPSVGFTGGGSRGFRRGARGARTRTLTSGRAGGRPEDAVLATARPLAQWLTLRRSGIIWLLHAFSKKAEKTPAHNIETAKQRLRKVRNEEE